MNVCASALISRSDTLASQGCCQLELIIYNAGKISNVLHMCILLG